MQNWNRKRLWGIVAVVFLVVAPLLCLPALLAELKFSMLAEEGISEQSVIFRYAKNHQVTIYDALRAEGPVDATCYVFLPSYADPSHVEVTVKGGSVEFLLEGETTPIVVNGRKSAYCSFETDALYTMRLLNHKGEEVSCREMKVLHSANLPTMYVTTDSGSMEYLDSNKDNWEPGSMELLDVDGKTLYADVLQSVSGRGNHTFSYDKKSYKLNLTQNLDMFGMGKSDSWILLSNVFDGSYIRNKLTYDMALQAGMYGSPQSVYVDVYFNGAYGGMYLLCEKVEIGENRLEYQDLEAENFLLAGGQLEDLYLTQEGEGKRKGVAMAQNPADISGAYLLERDYAEKYNVEISGFTTDWGENFVIQSPEHASMEQVNYIADRMQEIEDAIRSEDGYNPTTGKHFTEYIDLDSWADKYLVEEITKNNGSGLSSSYFYKPQDSISEKIFGGPVWDYDKALAWTGGVDGDARSLTYLTLHDILNTQWFLHLNKHEEFKEAVRERYRERFSEYLGTMTEEKIAEYVELIRASKKLDHARYSHVYIREPDLDIQVSVVKQFLEERKAFLDEVFLEDKNLCEVFFQGVADSGNRCLAVIEGECIDALPGEAEGVKAWRIEGTDEYLTTQTPITEDLTVIPEW